MATEIRTMLIKAHNDNNRKAITSKDAAKSGVGAAMFEEWLTTVEALRVDSYEFAKIVFDTASNKAMTKADKAKAMKKAQSSLYGRLNTIAKNCDLKSELSDVEIAWFAKEAFKYVPTEERGTQVAAQTKDLFRKSVETLLGVLICNKGLLSDEALKAIEAHQANVKAVDSAETKLVNTNTELENLNKYRAKAKSDEAKLAYTQFISPLEKTKKELENEIANLKKLVEQSKPAYDKAIAAIEVVSE